MADEQRGISLVIFGIVAVVAVVGLVLMFSERGALVGAYKYETQSRPGAWESGIARTPGQLGGGVGPGESRRQERPATGPQVKPCEELYKDPEAIERCEREREQLQSETWWERA